MQQLTETHQFDGERLVKWMKITLLPRSCSVFDVGASRLFWPQITQVRSLAVTGSPLFANCVIDLRHADDILVLVG